MMDPLWSETCWSTFNYFITLIISMNYIFVHLLDNKFLNCHWCTVKTWKSNARFEGSSLSELLAHIFCSEFVSITKSHCFEFWKNYSEFRLPPISRWELHSSRFYAESSGNLLPKFRDHLSILFSVVENPKTRKRWDPIGCPQTSARYYHYSLRNNLVVRSFQIRVKFLIFCNC